MLLPRVNDHQAATITVIPFPDIPLFFHQRIALLPSHTSLIARSTRTYAKDETLLVHAAVPANTFAIYGNGEDKELTELVPGILNQLGPDSLASLRKLAESYQNMQKEGKDGEEDDIPDLVEGENFESKVE